jgi:hypothetical protein
VKIRSLITAVSIAILPLAASAATFIIPAAGTGPGANNSRWQSELTFHNASSNPVTLGLTFHDATGAQPGDNVTVGGRSTVTISDIVATRFGRQGGTGAIEITVPDAMATRVAITSRTFNTSPSGEFGQDIPAINVNDAASPGDTMMLQAPSSAANARFNFGVYAVSDATIRWDLLRADGSFAASVEQSYAAGTQLQYGSGIISFLNSTEQNDDAIHAVVTKGKAIVYGSAVNNASGDPTFVPGVRGRADIRLNFIGVDVNGNGTIDATDADHDGVLDQPIDLWLRGYPTYFKVLVTGPNGEPASLEFIDPPDNAHFVDAQAAQWFPNPAEGPTTTLKVRATAAGITEVLTIPVRLHI